MGKDAFGWVGHEIDGRYRVESVVGEGGFGVVYKARHLGFGDDVAVKCLKVPASLDDDARARFREAFLEEGRLLRQLSRATTSVVQALDTGDASSPSGVWTPYLVLEWLEGAPLDQHLGGPAPRPPLSLSQALALLEPAARALGVAHAMGVAHRDIKPANLFVTRVAGASTLKVLDFGIAKVMSLSSSLTQAMNATGAATSSFTPLYGSPEQFNKRFGATGPWTDVFSLALVFVELASGRPALEGDDLTQLYITASDPSCRPGLATRGVEAPAAVEAVVLRALAVEPKDRFLSASAFWDELTSAIRFGRSPPPASAFDQTFLAPSGPAPPTQVSAADTFAAAPTLSVSPVASPEPARQTELARLALAATTTSPHVHDPAPLTPLPAGTDPAAPPTSPSAAAMPLAQPSPRSVADPPPAAAAAQRPRRGRLPLAAALALGAAGAGVAVAMGLGVIPWGNSPAPAGSSLGANGAAGVDGANGAEASSAAPALEPAPPGMARVAGGTFTMGAEGEGVTERPPHPVTLTRDFFLDLTEVTVARYRRCVLERKCLEPSIHGARVTQQDQERFTRLCNFTRPGHDAHPVNCVDRAQAEALCRFEGKRLPTEAEWERAARGGDDRLFPWGKEPPTCARAAVSTVGSERCMRKEGTVEVGSFPQGAAASGALDMAGNVWEWVEDGWDPGAYGRHGAPDPRSPLTGDMGVLRGGSWDFASATAKATYRLPFERTSGHVSTGVRCARTAAP